VKITKEMYEACKDALIISRGACNGCGISNALNRAYLAWQRTGYDTDETNKNPAVSLILHQLCHLAKIQIEIPGVYYNIWMDKCTEIMTQFEEQEELRIQEVNDEAK